MVYSSDKMETKTKLDEPRTKVRIPHLLVAKKKKKISAVTCYDSTFARLIENAPIDVVLVGDSLGHVMQGLHSTIPVTVEDICYHTRAVARALRTPHLVADMPFGTAGFSDATCFDAAVKLMQAGAEAVKIEGSSTEVLRQIAQLVHQGIPVMGHIGLTPQSVHALGGYRIQGKTAEKINELIQSAKSLEAAGCYAIVLELCAEEAGRKVTEAVQIPTIGIGSGPECDGQILVLQDMLGMNLAFQPKFLKHFEKLEERVVAALTSYNREVKESTFPASELSASQAPTEHQ